MHWRFVVTPPAEGPSNMALDEALMRRAARTGEGVFRVYGWSSPTLSLGRNQRARGCYDDRAARDLGVSFVRRPTGGRALLHHREVTYSATLPVADASGARAAYAFINGVLLSALRRLGVNAGHPAAAVSLAPGLRPCFDAPSAHEIAVNGRKLVGSAQWRHGGALLQHGSILIRDDQPLIEGLLTTPLDGRATSAATLADSLGFDPALDDVSAALRRGLEDALGTRTDTRAPDVEADAERLRARYVDDAWTWRR